MKKILFICLAAMALTACGGGSKEDKAKKEMKEAIDNIPEFVKEAVEEAAEDAEKEAKKALKELKK